MAMSIAHRVTGCALYGGTLLIAIWLVAAASGERGFAWAQWLAGSPVGLLVLFGYTYGPVPPHGRRRQTFHLGSGARI